MAQFITPLTSLPRGSRTSSSKSVVQEVVEDSGAPHLVGSFRLADQRFLWARMALYGDRIELRAWGWRGRFRRTVRLVHVCKAIWWTGHDRCNLELQLDDGTSVTLWTKAAGQWKYAIDRCLAAFEAHEQGIQRLAG